MKRVWAGAAASISIVMLMNGCSKCSHDELPAPPPGPPPAQDSATPAPPPGDESEDLPADSGTPPAGGAESKGNPQESTD